MRIAVVGATGRIGAPLTRALLRAGHEVRALSRGGPALDELAALGAEKFIGSFDAGTGELDRFFRDTDAAFLMVKTDWNNIQGHYPAVAQRFVDALADSSVKHAVNLTAIGSEVPGATGHFESFFHLDRKLDELSKIDIVHLRAAWFMENLLKQATAVAKCGRFAWFFEPGLKLPWIATADIADLAARELTNPSGRHRVVREVGPVDCTMPEVAAIMSRETGRPVTYRFVEKTPTVEAEYLKRFGTPELWLDTSLTMDALNSRAVRFHGECVPLPTTMETFIRDTWMPAYREALQAPEGAETFQTWCARHQPDSAIEERG